VSFPKNSVIARYLAGQVGQQRDVQRAETAFLAGRVDPGQVGKVGIGRASNNLLSLCNIKTFLTHFFVKMNFTREICWICLFLRVFQHKKIFVDYTYQNVPNDLRLRLPTKIDKISEAHLDISKFFFFR
jgi:hypothetical protein